MSVAGIMAAMAAAVAMMAVTIIALEKIMPGVSGRPLVSINFVDEVLV
jgi:hypothetical protein